MTTHVDYAGLVLRAGSDARRRLLAWLTEYGFGDARRLWNPTSGRDDEVTPTRTAVVICEDERGRRLCVKFYEDSEQGRAGLQWHAKCLSTVSGAVPVPEVIAAEYGADTFGLPALVMTYVGEPLDRAISTLSDRQRVALAEGVADSLAVLSCLDLRPSGIPVPDADGLRRQVAAKFAHDVRWYVEHARAADEQVRRLVLRGAGILAEADIPVSAASLCHSDLVASNITVRDGLLSGLIDWDYAEVGPAALDVGSAMLGLLVTIAIPRDERLQMLAAMLARCQSHAESCDESTETMALVFALDALLDWTIGGKDAPRDDLIWATSGVIVAIEGKAPLTDVLR